MKTIVNILKGIGITFVILVGLVLYQCNGPHSEEALVKELEEFKAEANQRERAGDQFQIMAATTFNSAERKGYYQQAAFAYGDAEAAWRSCLGNASKLGKYEKTKSYEEQFRALAERKISELDQKEIKAFAASRSND
ncbi:hypothetical protein [Floridanema aerugineum]|uniref:DUF4398 domain-containing protein n=1 Tax=Floridaenema aerugineum BLCC-F46 TaxID=3153654 RepID=A0ABV4XGQ3_9CYAN